MAVNGNRASEDSVFKGFAFDKFHDEEADVSVLLKVVERRDARVVERGENLGLPFKTREAA